MSKAGGTVVAKDIGALSAVLLEGVSFAIKET